MKTIVRNFALVITTIFRIPSVLKRVLVSTVFHLCNDFHAVSVVGYENALFPVFACICIGGSLLVVAVYQV